MEHTECTGRSIENKQTKDVRLGKRLAYLLRYGAEKEGLVVKEGGWIDLMQLIRVPMMKYYNGRQILEEVDQSLSHRDVKRFERKCMDNNIYVRAIYSRRIERNPKHAESKVTRLLEGCMEVICRNIEMYDFEGFPDEFLINTLIHKLKRRKRLNNKALASLLSPTVEHLDFSGVYLTERTIKLLGERCPHLKVLNLHDASYLMTDHLMGVLCKRTKELESLNVSSCRHLTDRSAKTIIKQLSNLIHLNAAGIQTLSEEAILNLATNLPKLKHLDIFDNRNLSPEGLETLVEIARQREMTIVLRGLEDPRVAPENPAAVLELWKNSLT